MKNLSIFLSFVALLALTACNGATSITPEKDEVSFTINGGEESVSIDADGSWRVKECPDWVDIEVQEDELVIMTEKNKTGEILKGNIVLEGKGDVTAIIKVTQTSKCTHITPESDKVEFEKEGGTKTVNIDTDGTPEVETTEGFTATYDNGVLTVTAASNEEGAKRGEIKLTCEDQKVTIYATQKGNICPTCGGSGKIRCPKCYGKGWYPIPAAGGSAPCERCGGRWNGFTDYESDWKDGTGRIKCPTCGGSGH